MGKVIKVPDPVYERITSEANERDIPRGVVVESWMKQAEGD